MNDLGFLFKPKGKSQRSNPKNRMFADVVVLFAVATRKLIEEIGKSSFIAMATGFWYEYSMAIPSNFGFDFNNRTAKFYNEGDTKISTSTWPQIGRAVAALLSLRVKSGESKHEACLENFRNKVVYVNSFTVSQKDMLASALRVTGSQESDWTISQQPARQVFSEAKAQIQEGKKQAFANFLYSRIFFPDGSGDFEHNEGTINDVLGLPKDDIDEATWLAIERQASAGGR